MINFVGDFYLKNLHISNLKQIFEYKINNMVTEKKFVEGVFGKVFTFQNGGEVYQLSAKAEDFIKFIKENTNSKGYINFDINKQKNDQTKLSVSLNTFEPKPQNNSLNPNTDFGLPF